MNTELGPWGTVVRRAVTLEQVIAELWVGVMPDREVPAQGKGREAKTQLWFIQQT